MVGPVMLTGVETATRPASGVNVAAVDPAPVDYLYFVARGDGTHEFSATLEAHNAAVARWQRGRR